MPEDDAEVRAPDGRLIRGYAAPRLNVIGRP